MALRTSFPDEFVQQLIKERGIGKAREILEVQNRVFSAHARVRNLQLQNPYKVLLEEPFKVIEIPNSEELKKIAASTDFYIQNATFVLLLGEMATHLKVKPKNIFRFNCSSGRQAHCFARSLS